MAEPFTFPPPNPRCRPLRLTDLYAHSSSPVNCVSLGRKSSAVMATGGDDCLVNCWKIGRSTPLLSLSGHTTEVDSVAFDGREELLCGGSRGGSVKLWDCASEKLLRSLSGHRASVSALDFHPFGDFFASGSRDCNVKVWDIKKRGCMQTYKGHDAAVTHVAHSPDGRWIVSGDTDGAVKVWDLTAGRLVQEFKTQRREAVASLAFHPAEFLLAVASAHSVAFWDMETFELVASTPREAGVIRHIAFDREGHALLSAQGESLRVWGWEPAVRCFDSVDVQWGGLGDLSISPNRELIAAGRTKGVVSVHLLDLPLLMPYAQMSDQENVPVTDDDAAPAVDKDVWTKTRAEHLLLPVPAPQSTSTPPPPTSHTSPKPKPSILASPNAAFFRAHATSSPVAVPAVAVPPPVLSAPWPGTSAVPAGEAGLLPSFTEQKSPMSSGVRERFSSPPSSASTASSAPRMPSPSQSVVSPTATLIPSQPAQPLNLSLSSFLPPPPAPSPPLDSDVIRTRLMAEHALMTTILSQRRQHLVSLLSLYSSPSSPTFSSRAVIAQLVAINDLAVAVDFLTATLPRSSSSSSPLLTLDSSLLLLPVLRLLLASRFESYVLCGLRYVRLILRAFAGVIREGKGVGGGVGVDVVGEERRARCEGCAKELRAMWRVVEGLKGKGKEVGECARDVSAMMKECGIND